MRKRLACIIFLLVTSLQLGIASNTDSFEISAYKIGVGGNTNEYFALYVVDSMYDSFLGLDSAESNNQIVINDKVHYLFDDLQNDPQPRTATFNADTMIFHVIAMGNRTGNYTLSIDFGPLKNEENGEVIRTAYTMGNARINFENSDSQITENGYTYYVSAPINRTDPGLSQDADSWFFSLMNIGPIEPSQNFTKVIPDDASPVVLKWAIAVPKKEFFNEEYESFLGIHYDYTYTLKNEISPPWIVRAAVAMSIDKKDYDSSPEGTYKSIVTVTFTQN